MTARKTEIAIQFKKAPGVLFRDVDGGELSNSRMVFRIQPDEGIQMRFSAKQPGRKVKLSDVNMNFRYSDYFKSAPSTGYETLIYDCLIGDATLFQRADNVESGMGGGAAAARRLVGGPRPGALVRGRFCRARPRPTICWRATGASGCRFEASALTSTDRISLLVSDIDGTLVTKDKTLTRSDDRRRRSACRAPACASRWCRAGRRPVSPMLTEPMGI